MRIRGDARPFSPVANDSSLSSPPAWSGMVDSSACRRVHDPSSVARPVKATVFVTRTLLSASATKSNASPSGKPISLEQILKRHSFVQKVGGFLPDCWQRCLRAAATIQKFGK